MYVVTRDELYLVPTAEVPVTNLHRDEILEAGRPADPLRRLLAVLPARGGRGRQGHPRASSGSTSSTRSRWSCSRSPSDSAAALEWMTERAEVLLQRLGLAYRVLLMSDRRHGLRPGEEVRPRGLGAGRGALARGQLVLELPRLPGAPDGHPLPPRAGRQAGARPHAQRVGPGARARSSRRSWRRTSSRTARSASPRCCGRRPGRERYHRLRGREGRGMTAADPRTVRRSAGTASSEVAGPAPGDQLRRAWPARCSRTSSTRSSSGRDASSLLSAVLGGVAFGADAGSIVRARDRRVVAVLPRHARGLVRVLPVLLVARRADAGHARPSDPRRPRHRRRPDHVPARRACACSAMR